MILNFFFTFPKIWVGRAMLKRTFYEDGLIRYLEIFHNLRGYDLHFIMQQIAEMVKKNAFKNKKKVKKNK